MREMKSFGKISSLAQPLNATLPHSLWRSHCTQHRRIREMISPRDAIFWKDFISGAKKSVPSGTLLNFGYMWGLVPELRQEAKDLEIKPYNCYQQSKRTVPLHVFCCTHFSAFFDCIEIQQKIKRCKTSYQHREANAQRCIGAGETARYRWTKKCIG